MEEVRGGGQALPGLLALTGLLSRALPDCVILP